MIWINDRLHALSTWESRDSRLQVQRPLRRFPRSWFVVGVASALWSLFVLVSGFRAQEVRASGSLAAAMSSLSPGASSSLHATSAPTATTAFTLYLPLILEPFWRYFPLVLLQNAPISPLPASGAVGQSPNMYLGWQFSDPTAQDLRYEVYLAANDDTPDELIAEDLAQTVYDPQTLEMDTQYYWRVVAIDVDGIRMPGPVWTFRTEPVLDPPAVGSMVEVPAGGFQMGCDLNNPAEICFGEELPLHRVYLDAYAIDKYEVTNKEYQACVEADACNRPRRARSFRREWYYGNPDYDYYPVVYVSWWDAQDYCQWVGKRLPTEAEWEKAARGPIDTRMWTWGNEPADCSRLNVEFSGDHVCVGDTTRVGSYPRGVSMYGVWEMPGNVFEWVNDKWGEGYYPYSTYYNPPGAEEGRHFVIRGGSFKQRWYYPRVAHRHFGHKGDNSSSNDVPLYRNPQVGFRCAKSLPDLSRNDGQIDQ